MIKLPFNFKDIPTDAVRRVIELLNQPQLVQTVREAAQQVGATTDWGTAQVQESMRQAKRWLDSVSGRWTSQIPPSTAPIVNATGDVFSSRFSIAALSNTAASAYASFVSGYSDDQAIISETHRKLADACGTQAVLVLPSVAIALQAIAGHRMTNAGWIVPRSNALRLPNGGDVFSILQCFGKLIEAGAVNTCSAEDLEALIAGQNAAQSLGLLTVSPSILSNQTGGSSKGPSIQELFLETSKATQVPYVELRFDASLCDLTEWFPETTPVRQRIGAGVTAVIFSGDAFVGAGPCGILAGSNDFIQPIRELVRKFGWSASTMTHAMLLGSLSQNGDAKAWRQAPIGEVLTCTIANQLQRARRIAMQIEASPMVKSVEVLEQSHAIGPAPFNTIHRPTAVIQIVPVGNSDDLLNRLKSAERSVVGIANEGTVQLVIRSIDPSDDRDVVNAFGINDANSEPEATSTSETE